MSYPLPQMLQHKRLPEILTWGLLALAVVYSVQVVRQWRVGPAISPILPVVYIAPLPDVEQYHAFGRYVANLDNLPETQLALTLQGVVVIPNQNQAGVALISSPGTPTQLYHVGDPIPGGATLVRVLSSQIILKNQGQFQRLRLPIKSIS